MNIQSAIKSVIARQDLSKSEMTEVMRQIMTGECTPSQIGGFLVVDNLAMGQPSMGGTRMLWDITPDISRDWCDKELPGIAEMLRSESYKETVHAVLSRGYAGLKNNTVLINFPGSVKAVRLCTRLILPVLSHAPSMFSGDGH